MSVEFGLIHSPLVGRSTWRPVASELELAGYRAVVPDLSDAEDVNDAFWRQHASSAAQAIKATRSEESLILVGHSGAGLFLPAIGKLLIPAPAAFLFIDAGLPRQKASRLELMRLEMPEQAAAFEEFLSAGGRYPNWTESDLEEIIPDAEVRRQVMAEMRPRGQGFFTEPIEAPEDWEQKPCGYLQFSAGYEVAAREAADRGWPSVRLDGGHFHMLANPAEVARSLLELVEKLLDLE